MTLDLNTSGVKVLFSHDTERSLAETAALVNTVGLDGDTLVTLADLDDFLARYPYSGVIRRTQTELESVRVLRHRLRRFWTAANRDEAATLANEILAEADARPYLTRHDEWDWHLHVTRPDAPLADRIAAEAAMAFLDLIRADALDRLRICAADDCEDVLIDLSKNSSKRYCDTGNCGNRTNVAAYRARKRLQRAL
ncbi:MAG TPA: CGNR zinc finger domain-containing protein [Propionibacteriaceae bacterium]|jgi:predicted RNA-binding Zn ribbon-like protein|nr:CGNR zinc finger domain-containing protein [Propionibacteriaceae bacterium]